MTAREAILRDIRTGLGRGEIQEVSPPPVRLGVADVFRETRIARMLDRVTALAGSAFHAEIPAEAIAYVIGVTRGDDAVASASPFLAKTGITKIPGVQTGGRELCATAKFGITSADYALTDTGTLVMMASAADARLISLLPPVHIAVVPVARLLSGLDELYTLVPKPAEETSSMVFITGPSRTADIEQRLVRGVHGPGQLHVVLVG